MLKDAKIISTDADLSQLLNSLKLSLAAIHTVKNIDDIISRAMQQTSIYVGELLLRQEALLLPSVHDTYAAECSCAANLDVEGGTRQLVTA